MQNSHFYYGLSEREGSTVRDQARTVRPLEILLRKYSSPLGDFQLVLEPDTSLKGKIEREMIFTTFFKLILMIDDHHNLMD
jgi:hypothetical protein